MSTGITIGLCFLANGLGFFLSALIYEKIEKNRRKELKEELEKTIKNYSIQKEQIKTLKEKLERE